MGLVYYIKKYANREDLIRTISLPSFFQGTQKNNAKQFPFDDALAGGNNGWWVEAEWQS
jgi:hypothetical protein